MHWQYREEHDPGRNVPTASSRNDRACSNAIVSLPRVIIIGEVKFSISSGLSLAGNGDALALASRAWRPGSSCNFVCRRCPGWETSSVRVLLAAAGFQSEPDELRDRGHS